MTEDFHGAAGFHGDLQSNQQCSDLPERRVWTVWHMIMTVRQKGLIHLLSEMESLSDRLRCCVT